MKDAREDLNVDVDSKQTMRKSLETHEKRDQFIKNRLNNRSYMWVITHEGRR